MSGAHLVLAGDGDVTAEIEVKRSRFLAVLRRTEDEEAARALVAELRRAHHAARHHCSAWILGADRQRRRSNDDGEPSGTAGAPMLAVLDGAVRDVAGEDLALSDVTAVVVRWFGGTLLGAGGLVRAYGDAVQAALDGAPLAVRRPRALVRIPVGHERAGAAEHALRGTDAVVTDVAYGAEGVTLTVAVDDAPSAQDRLAAWCAEHRLASAAAGTAWVDAPLP
ncbi:YigZ family protein [Patulibacter sp. SYSU D01012]|uniref:IMPACT family protein n=1 Tax=Patulibacter sp. SYSU D01012 TaxID=2817381 RepID=UPI001B313183